MRTALSVFALMSVIVTGASNAQTPQPFPRPGGAAPTPPVAAPSPSQPAPQPAPAQRQPAQPPPAPAPVPAPVLAPTAPQTPPAVVSPSAPALPPLPAPIYPTAQFITSYDAGKGQRYYVFGATASFADLVTYYRAQLKDRGNLVFDEPPTHMFEVGRFRDESMAFPPSVTIKDWTFGGSQGYPNPQLGGTPARFKTIIMIVPAPAGAAN